jgi:hypothetical protein
MSILPVVRLPVITVDDVRQLACSLEKESCRQLLRCLRTIPRTRVLHWDDQLPIVTEMRFAVPGRRWRLKYDEAHGWTLSELPRQRSSVPAVSATDVATEYRSLSRALRTLKTGLQAYVSSRGRAPSQLRVARAELERATDAWPTDFGSWEIDADGHVAIRLGEEVCTTGLGWQHFLRGEFAPAALAKHLLASRLQSSVPTVQRTLNRVRRHYKAHRDARDQRRRQT